MGRKAKKQAPQLACREFMYGRMAVLRKEPHPICRMENLAIRRIISYQTLGSMYFQEISLLLESKCTSNTRKLSEIL